MEISPLTRAEAAAKLARGLNCAQCVLGQYGDALDIDAETLERTAAAFGGGMSHGGACGCVTGALMALGLAFGGDGPEAHDLVMQKSAAFRAAFAEKFGSVNCRELLGYDFSVPGAHEAAAASGIMADRCPSLIAGATELLGPLMQDA